MTERVLIFIVIASAIVAVTLILGIVAIAKSVSDARSAVAAAVTAETLRQLKETHREME